MRNWIYLECKSVKQLERTCEELAILGVPVFLPSPVEDSIGESRGVAFCVEDKDYTQGLNSTPRSGDEKYYKRKDFIAAVKRVLGEAK